MDIVMCKGGDCEQKAHCIRFTGLVCGRQDFFGSIPYQTPILCDYFLDDRPSKEAIRAYAYQLWQQALDAEKDSQYYWFCAEKQLLALRRNSGY